MQKQKSILLIDDIHKILLQKLLSKGYMVDYHPEYDYNDVLQNILPYDALVVRSKVKIDKNIIDSAQNLKCIARSGAGMDSIDTSYAKSKGIVCLNSPEGNRDAVGEHTLGLLLCLFNKINTADIEVRHHLWKREENRGIEIKGKTIGIIGYGNMGHAFAKRLKGFDCNVIAYDKYIKNYGDEFVQEVSLQDLFDGCDVVSFHVPLTDETRYMANEVFFNSFHKPIYLINTSRGKIVRLKDLLCAMRQGKVAGCALDVLENENFNNEVSENNELSFVLDELFSLPNTVFTPHVAGWTVESYYKLADHLADKIITCLG